MKINIRPRIEATLLGIINSANSTPTATGERTPRSYNKIHEPYNWGVFALL